MPSVNREAVCIDEDSLVEAALRRTRVSRRGRGWSTKQESCFYPNEDVSLRDATSLGKSISPSPSKMCRLVKASSWCAGCAGLDDMETGIRSLDDALKNSNDWRPSDQCGVGGSKGTRSRKAACQTRTSCPTQRLSEQVFHLRHTVKFCLLERPKPSLQAWNPSFQLTESGRSMMR
jgi:hypothetical protein